MINLQLQKVLYKRVNSFFEMNGDFELEVQNTFSMNVSYTDDKKMCFATLTNQTNAPKNPDIFNIDLEIIGIFSCQDINSNDDKRDAHVQIYNYLFPYTQSMVVDLSTKAGLPPLMIERVDLDPAEININD